MLAVLIAEGEPINISSDNNVLARKLRIAGCVEPRSAIPVSSDPPARTFKVTRLALSRRYKNQVCRSLPRIAIAVAVIIKAIKTP
jgi:hypothetical protein